MADVNFFQRTLLDVTKYAKPGYYQPDTFFGDPNVPRQPVKGSVEGFQLTNNVMREADLLQKPGQNFASCATSWESSWSTLVNSSASFSPIVGIDDHVFGAPVIGHLGRVTGDRIVIPKAYAGNYGTLNPVLDKSIPAFVAEDVNKWTASDDWTRFSSSEQIYTVATTIDGTILMEIGYDVRGLDAEDPIMDLIVSTATFDLGALAVKSFVPALVRKVWAFTGGALRTFLLKRAAAAVEEDALVGVKLVKKLRASGKRVVVNIGGTGEVAEAINLNPNVVAPRVGIPNHIAAAAEDMGELFEPNSVDEIMSNSLPPNTLDWTKVLPAAKRILRSGATITIRFTGIGEDAKVILEQMTKLGFKAIQNGVKVGGKVIGEGAVITAVR